MRKIQIIIVLISSIAFGQKKSSEIFKKSLNELTELVFKDSLAIASQIEYQKELINKIEKEHDYQYKKIMESVSISFFSKLDEIKEDYLHSYFPNSNIEYFDSEKIFIKSLTSDDNDDELQMMSFGDTSEPDENYDPNLEKLKQEYLKLKEIEFKQSVMLTLSILNNNYEHSLLSKLDTNDFKFNSVINWLRKNKKKDEVELIKPAIMEKSYNLALSSML